MKASALRIENLQFAYSKGNLVLDMEEFVISRGEKLFLFGPSGSGKSTLLELIAGVLVSQQGRVEVLGRNLAEISAVQRDRLRGEEMGYVFQSFNLLPFLSVEENILLPLQLQPGRRARLKGESPEQAMVRLLAGLGIAELRQRAVSDCSIGQQQRVAVARAMIGNPDLVLADEPTSALDADHRQKFLDLLFAQLKQHNTALLFVSHDRSLESRFDRSVSLLDLQRQRVNPEPRGAL